MSTTKPTTDHANPTDSDGKSDDEGESNGDERAQELSLDVIFDILRNRRRRLVIEAIEAEDGETTLSDLAERIGGIENDKSPSALDAQERKRVYVGLYQCHLPRMDDADAVEFDKDRGTVTRGPMADAYLSYLESDADEESKRRWSRYYSALVGGSFVAFILSWTFTTDLAAPVFAGSLLLIAGFYGYHSIVEGTD
ncbi:ArsR family transcriptional regulator [Halorubrum sp. Atlit-26R]|uniref:DUF7344 domain-containing protein n=1 Tax=Halorubrum sp. Atlit-26R TaxID=2282128 RepID=UPI000EF1FEC4|nr:ArsR family transcriptional regulator [Halorubrum sp. Atlit-26R]RLM64175.1 ArsR family transcriptional regulator [Halorubrum sp. Atlit-26R]